MSIMRNIYVGKVTLNFGAGKDQGKLEKGLKLLKSLTNGVPVKTITQKRIPGWSIRPGLPIGCKVTLRKDKAVEILQRLLYAKDYQLKQSQIDEGGNISFGIPEYIDIKEAKYDPDIGIMGLEVSVTLVRPGFRLRERRLKRKKIPKKHRVAKDESMGYLRDNFNVKFEEE